MFPYFIFFQQKQNKYKEIDKKVYFCIKQRNNNKQIFFYQKIEEERKKGGGRESSTKNVFQGLHQISFKPTLQAGETVP